MELFDIAFAILILKITLVVLPGAFGIFLIVSSKHAKRKIRDQFCYQLFGFRSAIRFHRFAFFLYCLGTFLLLFSMTVSWFFVLKDYFQKG